MYKTLAAVLLLVPALGNSQALQFDYDASGNQIRREIVFNSLGSGRKDAANLVAAASPSFKKFSKSDSVSYYPNPVREELHLQWENKEEAKISSIFVYSLSGQLIATYDGLISKDATILPFSNYPQGVYNLLLSYSNGEATSIKIIKN